MTGPTYVIAATIPGGNRVGRFFDRDEGSPANLLEHPPTFRWAGFDLSTLDTARLVGSNCLEVRNGERKVLQLYQDGTFVARAAADASFLGWGQEEDSFLKFPRLNPVPVVEWHASFVRFYQQLIPLLKAVPEVVRFRLGLHNALANGNRLFLTPYYAHGIENVHNPKRFQVYADNPQDEVEYAGGLVHNEPDLIAYLLVERFAGFFDMPPDEIPFTKIEGEGRVIDVDAIKKL